MSNTYQRLRDREDQADSAEKFWANSKPTFKRENRYLVIKRKDIDKYLNTEERTILHLLSNKIYDRILELGIKNHLSVVIEDDWPEYEKVWQMIEDRVSGEFHD